MFAKLKSPHSAYPKLKCRAAECRHLGPVLKVVFEKIMDTANREHVMVLLCLKMSNRIDAICDEYPCTVYFKLPPPAASELLTVTRNFSQVRNQIAINRATAGCMQFDVTFKFHCLLHIAMTSGLRHPKLEWCYQGEDYMRKMKKLASSCLRGNTPQLAINKVLDRYPKAMHLVLLPNINIFR
jgi:hypothetical protein